MAEAAVDRASVAGAAETVSASALAQHPGTLAISDAIPAAREILQRAKLGGIDATFDGAPLPPSRFRLARWDVQAVLQFSDAEQISHLREFVLFLDPDLAPWTWARANVALVRLLAVARGEAVQAVYLEEALLRGPRRA